MDHLELSIKVTELQNQVDTMKKLCTAEGFYLFWSDSLKVKKKFPTNKSCFDYVNELYYELFGCYRYSDYGSFKVYQNRRNKQLKNNNGR